MGNVRSSLQSLGETVVDFDNALRDHRKRRGTLRSTPVALLGDYEAPGIGGKKDKADLNSLQDKENSAGISCLEGEATMAGALFVSRRNDTGDHEDLPCCDGPIDGRSVTSVGDDSEGVRNEESHPVQTKRSGHEKLGIIPTCREEVGKKSMAQHDIELDEAFNRCSIGGSSGGLLLDNSVTKPCVAPDRGPQAELRLMSDPELRSDGQAGVISLDGQSDTDAGRELATVDDGMRDAVVLHEDEAFEALIGVKKVPDPSETNDGLARHDIVPSVARETGVARATEVDETPSSAPQVVLGSVENFPLHIAPATTSFMESSDIISTTQQRRAGDWMEGTGNASRPLSSAVIVQEEAELAERVERLQSQRLKAQNVDSEVLDKDRASKIDWGHADHSVVAFSEEDQRALAAEQNRLVHLRRTADLQRLQLGAEFEEVENDLTHAGAVTAYTTATTIPVRGMRPQHYFEAEDLPENIREITDHRSVDKVLDEMESLATRTKSESGEMRPEEFENSEQRQRAHHVERPATLCGITVEEKGFTRLKMVLRLQLFARSVIAWNTVARLRQARSASEQKVTKPYLWCLPYVNRPPLASPFTSQRELCHTGHHTLAHTRLVFYTSTSSLQIKMLSFRAANGNRL